VPPPEDGATPRTILFDDEECAFCRRWVRWLAARDGRGRLHFAPLGGETFRRLFPNGVPDTPAGSVVVRTADGRVLMRSAAVLHVLATLGGAWRVLAWIGALVPRPLRDGVYTLVARNRHRLAGRAGACPTIPPAARGRFLP
jgi:predicted DCC family thiol-disulfide oxidoreductase YuxK